MTQTAVQNANTISFGSAKMEVSAYGGAGYINLGAMRNIVFEETWTENKIMSDNAGVIRTSISNQQASLSGDLMEIDLDNLYLIRGGIDTLTPVAAAPVVGHSQTFLAGSWAYETFMPLEGQQGSGALIVVTSVTPSTHAALTVNTEYENVLSGGRSGIVVHDHGAGNPALTENIVVVYTYTPAASHTLSSGGKYAITPIAVKITNTDASAKDCIIEIYKASNAQGITINLQPDEDGNPNVIPIKLTGTLDTAKAAGNQLFIITSEQL